MSSVAPLDKNHIDKVIQAHLDKFKKPGVLTVRPGYRIANGWITKQPAIVVTVQKKIPNVSPSDAIPASVGGISTDVRQATTIQKLRQVAPERHAALTAMMRPEFQQPEFPLERDAQTGKLLAKAPTPAPAAVAAHKAKPKVPYVAPANATLAPVEDTMSITCHVSPDAGWIELSGFLKNINNQLTVGMYDCTSAHVLAGLQAGLKGKPQLSLVLDHPAPNPTKDQTDEQTQQALSKQLGNREQFAWAAEGNDPMVTSAIFPNAYHIKVAVKDHASFWLSSGNWNNSNQPDINPFAAGGNKADIDATANKSDRDWHVIVEHAGLSKTFEAFLLNDRTQAAKYQVGAKKAAAQAATVQPLLEALAESPEAPIVGKNVPRQYFQPKSFTNQKIKVQPVLTPDTGAGNYSKNFLKLIQSAQKTLDIQTQYIHPPKQGVDAAFQSLISAVQDRINNHVQVRVILSEYEATGGWLEKLQEAGLDMSVVRIQNGVHNKGFVVDSSVVAIGSQNWSGDGVLRNRDASLIIYYADAAQYYEQIFSYDWLTFAKQHLSSEVSTGSSSGSNDVAAD
jgi:PLD-like domain